MTHTPTPWEFIASAENDKWIWIGPAGWETRCARVVLYEGQEEEQKANAAYIVQCVNSHASLVEENKRMREALEATRALVSEASATGFNWQDGDWADRLYKNNGSITKALKGDTNA